MINKYRYAGSLLALSVLLCVGNTAAFADSSATSSSPLAVQAGKTAPLNVMTFNPGEQAIFAVSSVLVEGKKDAILIDAQFSAEQARKLADRIKASGKHLTTIYISHGDPDYYFGLEALHHAFPHASIVATAETVAHIQATKDEKLTIWKPKLGMNAPEKIIVPEILKGNKLSLEGHTLDIIDQTGSIPDRTFVWIPSIKTVVGGVPVVSGEHVWMADSQTAQSRTDWLATLEKIKSLKPAVVIPGHFEGILPAGLQAVDFTENYIKIFEHEAAKAPNSASLIQAMKQHYPQLGGEGSLELSAKVAKGEMAWK